MTSTKAPSPVDRPEAVVPGFAGRAPTLRRPRNLPGAVLGVLLIVVCSLLVAAFASSANHRSQVLVITRAVPAGATLTAGDLRATGVAAGPSLRGIRASEASTVIGREAADNLVPGTLLVNAELSAGPVVGVGLTVVGLALKPGSLPVSIAPQDHVTVLDTPTDAATGTSTSAAGGVLVGQATIYSVASSPDGQSTLVSVEVPADRAPPVAEANAQGSISLVLLGG